MKILGFNLFEKLDLELESYKADLVSQEREKLIKDCQGGGLIDIDLYSFDLYGDSEAKARLEAHRQKVKKGICHIFNYKKYCYHTGKEIISVQK